MSHFFMASARSALTLACVLAFTVSGAVLPRALAETPATSEVATAPAATTASLYTALGEKPGIDRLVGDLVARLVRHPRIGEQFKDTKPAALQEELAEQFCELSGGPCSYQGADMRKVHADMDIDKADFHALVEALQDAMDAQDIAFAQQNRLLALLAPMHRDIITVR